jgi:hypothetical protein
MDPHPYPHRWFPDDDLLFWRAYKALGYMMIMYVFNDKTVSYGQAKYQGGDMVSRVKDYMASGPAAHGREPPEHVEHGGIKSVWIFVPSYLPED